MMRRLAWRACPCQGCTGVHQHVGTLALHGGAWLQAQLMKLLTFPCFRIISVATGVCIYQTALEQGQVPWEGAPR